MRVDSTLTEFLEQVMAVEGQSKCLTKVKENSSNFLSLLKLLEPLIFGGQQSRDSGFECLESPLTIIYLAMGSVHQGGLMLHVIDYEIVVASQLSACFE